MKEATITDVVAGIAAQSGSVVLLQQNQLPGEQTRCSVEQTTREELHGQPAAIQIWQIPTYPDQIAGIWRIAR